MIVILSGTVSKEQKSVELLIQSRYSLELDIEHFKWFSFISQITIEKEVNTGNTKSDLAYPVFSLMTE